MMQKGRDNKAKGDREVYEGTTGDVRYSESRNSEGSLFRRFVIPKHANCVYLDVRQSENEKGPVNPNICGVIPKGR